MAGNEGIEFLSVRSGKLRRYFSLKTLVEPANVCVGFFQSLSALKRLRPAFVFSKGGYVSLPAAVAAKTLGIPVYLQESDAVPGLSNRWVGKFSDVVFLGFAEAARYFPGKECVVSGQLLDPTIPWGNFPNVRKTARPLVLAIGGSLGSSRVFEAVFAAAETLPEYDFEIVLGKLNTGLREKFSKLPNVVCHDFLAQTDMAEAYARATAVITRAGATSLAEIEASGADMLIVPLEGSANDHQRANAAAYATKGYGVLYEKDLPLLSGKLVELVGKGRDPRTKSDSASKGIAKVVEVLSKR